MKKIVLLGALVITFFGWGEIASADNISETNTIVSEIEELERSGEYDFELIPTENLESSHLIQLDSVQELEKILADFKANSETEIVINESMDTPIKTRASGSKTITQWAPFSGYGMTGLPTWRNVSFKYDYKKVNGKKQFTKVSAITSYYSGLQVAVSWNQTSSSYNLVKTSNTKDTAKIKVNGYSLLGFQVKGFSIGTKINDTWNVSFKI